MANQFYQAPTANFVTKTLNGTVTDVQTTITLNSTANLQAPGYVVINRVDSSGNALPATSREVVSYTGISGSDLTGCTRAADNGTARTHADGSVVETMPTVGMWNSLSTIVATALTSDGYLKAINSPVSVARLETPFIRASSALFSIVTISGLLNAAGASIVGLPADPLTLNQLAITSTASIARLTIPVHLNVSGASITGAFANHIWRNITPTDAQTTTNTSFEDMTNGVTSFILATPSDIKVDGHANLVNSGAADTYIRVTIGSGATVIGTQGYSLGSTDGQNAYAGGIITNVAAGNVTIAMQKKVAAGTGTYNQPNLQVTIKPAT